MLSWLVLLVLQTMSVIRSDFTFASSTGTFETTNQPMYFGEAEDKYTKHYNGKQSDCGPFGSFDIDLRGTRLKVDDRVSIDEK